MLWGDAGLCEQMEGGHGHCYSIRVLLLAFWQREDHLILHPAWREVTEAVESVKGGLLWDWGTERETFVDIESFFKLIY